MSDVERIEVALGERSHSILIGPGARQHVATQVPGSGGVGDHRQVLQHGQLLEQPTVLPGARQTGPLTLVWAAALVAVFGSLTMWRYRDAH